jgi:hypothetical protein
VLHYDDLEGMRELVRYALADDARIRLLAGAAAAKVDADLAVDARGQVALERRLLHCSRDRHGARRYPIARLTILAGDQASAR